MESIICPFSFKEKEWFKWTATPAPTYLTDGHVLKQFARTAPETVPHVSLYDNVTERPICCPTYFV